ncbi:MAG: hypothetical protein LBP42_02520, partial [Treponema sp.]|nr:hypothetical protein [Treponema sp.]
MRVKKGLFFSPVVIFILYLFVISLVIMGFRYVFPAETAPLRIFSFRWRLIGGVLEIIGLFPALAMSALVVPIGLQNIHTEVFTPFSPRFLEWLKGSVLTAVCAVVINGLLCFLVLPLAENDQSNMRFEGYLFRLAKTRAAEYVAEAEWPEADRFITLCEQIWPGSPEIEYIRTETAINMDELR